MIWVDLTYSFLMLSQCGVDDAHVKENLTRIRDFVKLSQSIIKLIIIITTQGRNPGLDFLQLVNTANPPLLY